MVQLMNLIKDRLDKKNKIKLGLECFDICSTNTIMRLRLTLRKISLIANWLITFHDLSWVSGDWIWGMI